MKNRVVIVTLTVFLIGVSFVTENQVVLAQTNHPRLFFTADELPGLREKAQSTHAEIWAPILAYVESLVGTLPPTATPVNGDEEAFRQYGNQLIPLAFVCVISEDDNHCDLAKDYLLTYATWSQWDQNNFRDLGLAHMLMGSAIAYDWLFPVMSPEEQQTAREALAAWGQRMYEASIEPKRDEWNNWWAQSYLQNHASTNHSALGMAGLALRDEDQNAWTWVQHAWSQLARDQFILNGIGDGSWHEGISYQNYKLTMLLPFVHNLKRLQGLDILANTYLHNYVSWRLYNHLPGKVFPLLTFGNLEFAWGNSYAPENILRFIANEYESGQAEWLAQQLTAAEGRFANIFRTPWYVFEFLYYDPAVTAQPPTDDLPLRQTFSDLEGVIWRTGWDDDALLFGLKTGAYGGRFAFDTFVAETYPWNAPCLVTSCQLNIGHDHDDMNSFYIYRSGSWLTSENVGAGIYDSAYHNTLLIDNEGQDRPPDNSWRDPDFFIGIDGFLEATAGTQDFDYLAADVTQRYDFDDLEDVTRHVLFVRPSYFVMLDNLAAANAHQYDWVAHFDAGVSVEGNWVRGEADDGQILGVGVVSPTQFQAITGNDGYPYVRVRPAQAVDDTRLLHILFPTDAGSWDVRPNVELLDDSGEAIAARLETNDGIQDDIILAYTDTLSTAEVGPYIFDGRAAFVRITPEQTLESMFVYGGTSLNISEVTIGSLVSNLSPTQPFEAVYQDNTVAVSGNIITQVRLYAPLAEHLTVNESPTSFTRDGDHIIFPAEAETTLAADTTSLMPLGGEMVAEPPFTTPGHLIEWSITVSNPNLQPETNIIVEDIFPDEIEILSATSTSGAIVVDRQAVTCTQDFLGPKQTFTIFINSRIRSETKMPFVITNQASIRSFENPDPRYVAAQVLSATELPATGESPWQNWRGLLVLIVGLGAAWLILRQYFRLLRSGFSNKAG